jgi:small ligand-binding sensory domain FIST
MNRCASALVALPDAAEAARHAVAQVEAALGGESPDLAVLFATPDLMANARGIAAIITAGIRPGALIGCTGEAIAGTGGRADRAPALALWAAVLGTRAPEPFALRPGEGPDGQPVLTGWPPHLDPAAPGPLASGDPILLLADPFSFPPGTLAGHDGQAAPRTVVGGLASGGRRAGDHRLVIGEEVLTAGAVGVAVPGMRAVVSQGCRPVGPEMTITGCRGPVITHLAGKPALERALVGPGVLIGLALGTDAPMLAPGDFLVRGVAAVDEATGAIAVGEHPRLGQVVQVQVRDAASADADLQRALSGAPASAAGGALLFTCTGRAAPPSGTPHHDALAVHDALGGVPLAGIACNGEIGPVGGESYLHAHTATVAVFTRD